MVYFNGCESARSLPDISNWNTKNVQKMNKMFSDCLCLKELPDLSNWDTFNVIIMNSMFANTNH